MKTIFVIALFFTAAGAQVTLDDIRNMPVNSWLQVPGTMLNSVDPCPTHDCPYTGVEGVMGIHSYSGATLDTKRNRLVCWGGGHNAYYGNEVYAFAIDEMKWYRLTNPSTQINISGAGTDPYPDGQPSSRHLYNGQAYIAHADHLFMMSGVLAAEAGGCGTGGNNTWTFDLVNNTWKNMKPPSPIPAPEWDDMAVYDPASKKVFWGESHIVGGTDLWGLWSYDFNENRWSHLNANTGYSNCIGIVDTKRNLLVIVGNAPYVNIHVYDIGSASFSTPQAWTTTGGDSFIAAYFKGLSYDPVADRYVGVDGTNTVWSLNPDTKVWSSHHPAGTAPDQGHLAGIYGLWQYVPGANAYIFQTAANRDVTFYKFTAGGGTASQTDAQRASLQPVEVRPNPFRSATAIRINGLNDGAAFSAAIYDMSGRLIRKITTPEFTWDARAVPPGLYLLKAAFEGKTCSHRLMIMR